MAMAMAESMLQAERMGRQILPVPRILELKCVTYVWETCFFFVDVLVLGICCMICYAFRVCVCVNVVVVHFRLRLGLKFYINGVLKNLVSWIFDIYSIASFVVFSGGGGGNIVRMGCYLDFVNFLFFIFCALRRWCWTWS